MLGPTPVVVDADVLIRNVDYAIRRGYPGALFGQASGNYTLVTGVVLFATPMVGEEAKRHLPEVAERRGVPMAQVWEVWNNLVLPHVRFVDVSADDVEDPRVDEVLSLDAPDVGSAALASLLAPAVLVTDNRKHFRPMGLSDVETDLVAIDLFAVGQFGGQANAALLFPRLGGIATVEGSKKLIAKLGGDGAAIVGLLLLGALVLLLTTERGQTAKRGLAEAARKAGPPLAEAVEKARVAGERVAAFAVEPTADPTALSTLARRLAVGQTVMTTREVGDELRGRFAFDGSGRFDTQVRAWLVSEPCFNEGRRGHWTLGYHLSPSSTS